MKVSLVITILNEAENIQNLLLSVREQTKQPDEIIFVDAGSTDQTVKIINSFQNSSLIRMIELKGANRSVGRNAGIQAAKNQVVAVTDAGCTLDDDWLENISKVFDNPAVQSVAGYYQVKTDTILQKCFAPYMAVMPDKFNPKTYLPSSRSIAFRKSAWLQAGKYPEHLNYCEDLVFAVNLRQVGDMIAKPEAFVHWQLPKTFWQFFKRIGNYASGDIMARYQPHLKKIFTVYARYLVFALLPIIYPLYLLYPIFKHYHYVKHPLAVFLLPLTQLTSDLAVLTAIIRKR